MPLHYPPLPDDLVTFNVRGRIFQTTLTTLRRFRESILYKMVEYEQQRMRTTSTESSSHEAFFVDRDPDHFASILRYHDTNEYSSQTLATDPRGTQYSVVTPRSLLLEAQYYNIPSLEEAIVREMKSPAVTYEYCIIMPHPDIPPPHNVRWAPENVDVEYFQLSEAAGQTYSHRALDGLLDSGNYHLFGTVVHILGDREERLKDYEWTLWAARSAGEEKNMAIILRGDRKV
jgi:hypothetical protein